MKHKSSTGTGMLSAAGLSGGVSASGTGKTKALGIAPPPGKIRSPLPPPPNDPAAARMTAGANHSLGLKSLKDTTRRSTDPLSDLSQLDVWLFSLYIFILIKIFQNTIWWCLIMQISVFLGC